MCVRVCVGRGSASDRTHADSPSIDCLKTRKKGAFGSKGRRHKAELLALCSQAKNLFKVAGPLFCGSRLSPRCVSVCGRPGVRNTVHLPVWGVVF